MDREPQCNNSPEYRESFSAENALDIVSQMFNTVYDVDSAPRILSIARISDALRPYSEEAQIVSILRNIIIDDEIYPKWLENLGAPVDAIEMSRILAVDRYPDFDIAEYARDNRVCTLVVLADSFEESNPLKLTDLSPEEGERRRQHYDVVRKILLSNNSHITTDEINSIKTSICRSYVDDVRRLREPN